MKSRTGQASGRFLIGVALIGSAISLAWQPVHATPTTRLIKSDAASDRYFDVDTSSDGLIAYTVAWNAGTYSARTKKSVNGGIGWTELSTSPTGDWWAVSTSADGQKVAIVGSIDASANGSALYVSLDAGATWTRSVTDSAAYNDVAISANGGTIVVTRPSGVEISINNGVTWDTKPLPTSQPATKVAVSANGSKIVAIESTSTIWRSVDSGSTWTELTGPSGSRLWQDIAISDDGETVFAVDRDDQGYIWKDVSTAPTRYRTGSLGFGSYSAVRAAISPDGNSFIAGAYNANPRVLRNWDRTNPETMTWETQSAITSVLGFSITNAGARFIAVTEGGGGIWTYVPTAPAPVITGAGRTPADCTTDSFGPTKGGTLIKITGRYLFDASVSVGGTAATITSNDSLGGEIQVEVPPGTAGVAPIVVTTSSGSATAPEGFTYLAPPSGWEQVGAPIVGEPFSLLGEKVTLSANGTIAAVSAPNFQGDGYRRGLVKVYVRSGTTWVQRGGDITGDGDWEYAGQSIAISADGATLVVGSPGFGYGDRETGRVRVFRWSGSTWDPMGAAIVVDDDYSYFGYAVAVSADGETFALSSTELNLVRVYQWSGSMWMQVGGEITGPNSSGDFGEAIAMSADGETLVVGEPMDDFVHVYQRVGSTWQQVGGDIDGGTGAESFGRAVAISADGQTIAVGDPYWGGDAGIVRVYHFDGSSWIQRGNDFEGSPDTSNGLAVDLSADGNVVAYTASRSCRYEFTGEVILWSWNGSAWVQKGDFIPAPTRGDGWGFGWSIAMDDTGTNVMSSDFTANSERGEIYLWRYLSTATASASAEPTTIAEPTAIVDSGPTASIPIVAPITELPNTGSDGRWALAVALIASGTALIASTRRSRRVLQHRSGT